MDTPVYMRRELYDRMQQRLAFLKVVKSQEVSPEAAEAVMAELRAAVLSALLSDGSDEEPGEKWVDPDRVDDEIAELTEILKNAVITDE